MPVLFLWIASQPNFHFQFFAESALFFCWVSIFLCWVITFKHFLKNGDSADSIWSNLGFHFKIMIKNSILGPFSIKTLFWHLLHVIWSSLTLISSLKQSLPPFKRPKSSEKCQLSLSSTPILVTNNQLKRAVFSSLALLAFTPATTLTMYQALPKLLHAVTPLSTLPERSLNKIAYLRLL